MSARGAVAESEMPGIEQIVQGKGRDYALYGKRISFHQEKTEDPYSVLHDSFYPTFCSFSPIRTGSHKKDHDYRL